MLPVRLRKLCLRMVMDGKCCVRECCKYEHDPALVREARLILDVRDPPDRGSEPDTKKAEPRISRRSFPCRFFARTGSCKRGDK